MWRGLLLLSAAGGRSHSVGQFTEALDDVAADLFHLIDLFLLQRHGAVECLDGIFLPSDSGFEFLDTFFHSGYPAGGRCHETASYLPSVSASAFSLKTDNLLKHRRFVAVTRCRRQDEGNHRRPRNHMEAELIIVGAAALVLAVLLFMRLRDGGPAGPAARHQRHRSRHHAFMKTPEAWAGRAQLLLDRNRPDLALRLLDDALEQFPHEPRLKKLRARAEEARGDS